MKNHNELLREKKEIGIKEAIKYLYNKGVNNFTKKNIADTTKLLFKNESDKQINTNTLSKKDYYKNNLDKWIEEITGIRNDNLAIGRNNSLIVRKDNAKENYKKIEKESNKIVKDIINGKIKCEKLTKKFLTQRLIELKDIKGISINESTFSSKFYEPIYDTAVANLNQGIFGVRQSEETVTFKTYSKLKEENQRLKEINNNLINGVFFIKDGEYSSHLTKDGDGSDLFKVILDTKKIHYYMRLNEDVLINAKKINAYKLFEDLITHCRK